jgi:integrase
VPLSAPVRALIEALADEDELPKSGYVFEIVPSKPLYRLDGAMRTVIGTLSIDPATPHDLRRTFASLVASLGFGRQAIDRLLNHADRSISAVYDRHSYAKEDQQIVQAVANKITALVEDKSTTNVVQLTR